MALFELDLKEEWNGTCFLNVIDIFFAVEHILFSFGYKYTCEHAALRTPNDLDDQRSNQILCVNMACELSVYVPNTQRDIHRDIILTIYNLNIISLNFTYHPNAIL